MGVACRVAGLAGVAAGPSAVPGWDAHCNEGPDPSILGGGGVLGSDTRQEGAAGEVRREMVWRALPVSSIQARDHGEHDVQSPVETGTKATGVGREDPSV